VASDFPDDRRRRTGQRPARRAQQHPDDDYGRQGYPGHGYDGPGHPNHGYAEQGYAEHGHDGPGYPEAGYAGAGHPDQGQAGPGYPGQPGPGYPPPGSPAPGYQAPGYAAPGYQDRRGHPAPDGRYARLPAQSYAAAGHPGDTAARPGPEDTAYLAADETYDPDADDAGPPGTGRRARPSRRAPRSPAARGGMNRRAFIGVAAGLGVAGAGAIAASQLLGNGGSGPKYAFADDFNGPAGSAPDPTKWAYDLGGGGWGNNELEVYTSSRQNSFLDGNGNLVIRATRSTDGSGQVTYSSARLKTLGKFSQYRGTFEARIKIDPQEGAWPAWWMMGADIHKVGWPQCGEVDILENFGGSSVVDTSVHTPAGNDASVNTKRGSTPVDGAWHVWRMRWTAGGLTFFKDGTQYMHMSPGQAPNWVFGSGVPMFMLLNLAVGGAAGTPPDNARFPIDMLVDYVHVW
jgi:beta-glucanase (GH16 family)